MMLIFTLGSLLLLARLSTAQTPAGFTPEVEDHLDVIFGTTAVATPGASFAKPGPLLSEYAALVSF